jgi:AraC-like DNA-binding protein
MVVKAELEKIGLHVIHVNLGEIELKEPELSPGQLNNAKKALRNAGFELIDDRKTQIVEQIKVAIIELIHYQNDDIKIKHSEYLAQHLNYDYSFLSKTFSEEEGITIEQYIIHQRIEKVKELLAYGQLTLSEIAWQMGYSSVAALSSQFKKVVGITPSAYKQGSDKSRNTLDKVGKE